MTVDELIAEVMRCERDLFRADRIDSPERARSIRDAAQTRLEALRARMIAHGSPTPPVMPGTAVLVLLRTDKPEQLDWEDVISWRPEF